MKINDGKKRQPVAYLRICLFLLILLTMVMAGCLEITPNTLAANLTECLNSSYTFSTTGQTCPTAPFTYFYWLVGSPPAWVTLDAATGELTACPPLGSAGTYEFYVGVTEMHAAPYCESDAWPAKVTFTVAPAAPPPDPLTIVPTFVWAWSMESMPFYLPLSAIGCSGNYTWSAVGLPPGLSLHPYSGEITGVPPLGSAGIYNVTATVNDNMYTCSGCCPPASRPFILVIDSYADYLGGIIYGSSYGFTVQVGPGLAAGATPVLIDGASEATLGGNQSASFISHVGEKHLVGVEQTIAGADPNTRYGVIGPNQLLVSESSVTAFFDYAREVFIQTGSEPAGVSQPPGAGYYAVGSSFTSSADSPVNSMTQQDTKYVFKQWVLPDGSARPGRELSFTVSGSGNVKAVYDTYYQLKLQSDYPPVNQSSWELKDSTASYDLALREVPMTGFWGLLGGTIVPVNGSGTQLMTAPYTQVITWAYNYTIPIIILVVIALLLAGLVILIVTMSRRRGARAAPTTVQPTQPVAPAVAEKTEPVTEQAAGFCPKCGNPVDKDAAFCKKCGNKIG
jgi:hypothetical protein